MLRIGDALDGTRKCGVRAAVDAALKKLEVLPLLSGRGARGGNACWGMRAGATRCACWCCSKVGALEELKGLKYTSTETEAATDCRYLDYDSNPAISAEVAAERGELDPRKAPKTN